MCIYTYIYIHIYIYIVYTCLTQSQHGIFSLGRLRSGTFEKLWIELVEATFLSHLSVAVWQFLGSVNVMYMGVVQFRGASQSTQQGQQHWDCNTFIFTCLDLYDKHMNEVLSWLDRS